MNEKTTQLQSHFSLLIYPFHHTVGKDDPGQRLARLNDRWQPWWGRFDHGALQRTLDDTYFFLSPIRNMLFPETALLPLGDASQQVEPARQLAQLSIDALATRLSADGVLRLTCRPQHLQALHPLRIEFERRDENGRIVEGFYSPLRIDWIDIALFPQNIGFLILKMELEEPAPTIDQINDTLYHLRLIHPPTIDWQLAQWRRMTPETPLAFASRDLVDFLLQGLTEDVASMDRTLGDLAKPDSQSGATPRYSATETGQVHGDIFREYSYACLAETSAARAPSEEAASLFASPLQQALYELATCTQTADPDYRPHPQGLRQTMEQAHIALWANWEAMALHDNVVFLGARPTPFTLKKLPHNVGSDYFHLFLLTLYQKMRLSLLSGELMRHGADLHRNLQETRRLMDAFTAFRNHYWLAEVTRKPQGGTLYRRFQQGLGVASLYESIQREVNQLQEYYEQQAQRDLDQTARQLQREMAENVAATKELQVSMTRNLETVAKVQLKLEYIEVILVSVYLAELWHLLAPELAHHLPWLEHVWWIMPIKGWGILFFAVVGAVLTLSITKPWQHQRTQGH